MAEKLRRSLQEDTITLLVHSDEHGGVVARLVEPNLFEGEYRTIADRAVTYWQDYGEAPKVHMVNLLSDMLDSGKNERAPAVRGILRSMEEVAPDINAIFVTKQLDKFVRLQKMKGAIIQSFERLQQKQELAIDDVEKIWTEMLSAREFNFDPGTRFDDVDGLMDFLERRELEFDLGIPMLDNRGVVPMRQTLMMYVGEPSSGKTWFAIHAGKRALIRNKKVCHITIGDMGEKSVLQRYYQAMFSLSKRRIAEVPVTSMILGGDGKLIDFGKRIIRPEFSMYDPDARDELSMQLLNSGIRAHDNLVIKGFPNRGLTLNGLKVYLDNLQSTEGFVPDLLLLDYPQEMDIPTKDHRLALGQLIKGIRGLCVERNIAGIALHQTNREGSNAKLVTRKHTGEDWSIIATADFVLTYSSTEMEQSHGLGRLFVDKAREEESHFGVLMTQGYKIGQYCLESIPMPRNYWDELAPRFSAKEEED